MKAYFYLEKRKQNTNGSPLYIYIRYQGKLLRFFVARIRSPKEKLSYEPLLSQYREALIALNSQGRVSKESITAYLSQGDLFSYFDEYLSMLLVRKRKPSTISEYRIIFAHIVTCGISTFYEPDYLKLVSHMETKGLGTNTIAGYMKKIKTYIKWVQRVYEVGTYSNLDMVDTRKVEPDTIFLTEREILQWKAVDCYPDVRDIFLFSCYTGLRDSDLRTFDESMIIDGILIKATIKTGKVVRIPLLPEALELLPLGHIPGRSHLNKVLKRIAAKAGIEKTVTTHSARHTFATLCLCRGLDIYSVKELMGHSSVKVTEHYARLVSDQVQSRFLHVMTGGIPPSPTDEH